MFYRLRISIFVDPTDVNDVFKVTQRVSAFIPQHKKGVWTSLEVKSCLIRLLTPRFSR